MAEEDERVSNLISKIISIKNIIVTGAKYTTDFELRVEKAREEIAAVWNEIHELKALNASLVERVESEAPTLPDNPIPLVNVTGETESSTSVRPRQE